MLRLTTATCLLLTSATAAQELLPRTPLRVDSVQAAPLPAASLLTSVGPVRHAMRMQAIERQLIVKFEDSVRARADDAGELYSEAAFDLAGIDALETQLGTALSFRPLIQAPGPVLAAFEARAAARSGRTQPDLAGMLIVLLPAADIAELERVGQALNDRPEVEWAWIESLNVPPPGDVPPTTPSLVHLQGWRGPDPGLDVDYAWSVGARGQGVRLSDCEYGWDPDHEDLNDTDLHLEPGQTIPGWVIANGWDDHGTAALSEAAAQDNAYGCSGISPEADFYTWPEWSVEEGSRRVTCIMNAIAASSVGDIVLLEMQTTGDGGGFGPAELDPAVWILCKAGSDAGVIVVGAAGNGNQDLDSPAYDTYSSWGDSGAIIVGAGSPDTNHSKLDFSTFGARVNMQGWGGSVFTLAYGGYATYGGDEHQTYTSSFGGTSSASPFVAGSCTALQSYIKAQGGALLSPAEMRDLLITTGLPQGSGGHIGPFPDLRGALDSLPSCPQPQNYCMTSPNSVGAGSIIGWAGSTSIAANDATVFAEFAPPGQFGIFFYGEGESALPFGEGLLCVDGGSNGHIRMDPPISIDALGSAQLLLDYTQPPMDAGPGQVMVGDSRRWQFWYRDPAGGGAAFNLSDGVHTTYCP